jgi:hypothetical protein
MALKAFSIKYLTYGDVPETVKAKFRELLPK